MKSKFLGIAIAALAISLSASGVSFAMPSGADSDTAQLTKVFPAEMSLPADAWGVPLTFGFGWTTDYVIDRTMESSLDLSDNVWTGGNVYWDPHERVHLDLFLGAAWLTVGGVPSPHSSTTQVELKTDSGFAIGTSGKIDIVEFQVIEGQSPMRVFAGGGYRFTNPDVDSVHAGFEIISHDLNIEVNEWSAMAGVSQRIQDPFKLWLGWGGCNFAWVPYVAAQYTDLDLNISGTSNLPGNDSLQRSSVGTGHFNADDVVNVVAGMQIVGFEDKLSLGVEGRFVAETAVSFNVHFRW